MDMTIRAMKPDERNYSYTQEKSVQKNTGCIGHLRGDMGRSGEEFYTSWDDHEASLKTETFKSEFNSIVNALRKDERYGLLLSSRKTLAACCHAMPDCAFDGSSAQEYGFRADTKAYSYMIRCNPTQGNYNFYIYAYDRAKLDKVLEMQKEQMQKCEVPVYLYPRTYAQKHGEMEEYRVSRQAATR